jgi:uncharacterized protein (DUF433 family)
LADHPLIGVGANELPVLLGSRIPVWDVVRVWQQEGNDAAEAATFLGIGAPAVEAAVSYWDDLSQEEKLRLRTRSEAAASGSDSISTPERVAQLFALFAGLATIIYITGGVVLVTRLRLADLPWEPVAAQLPREFLISVGISQVLVPSLIVATLYAGYRLLWRPGPPDQKAWKYNPRTGEPGVSPNRWNFIKVAGGIALLVFLPVIVAIWTEVHDADGVAQLVWTVTAGVGALVCALLATEIRGRQALERKSEWRSLRSRATMTAVPCGAVTRMATPRGRR